MKNLVLTGLLAMGGGFAISQETQTSPSSTGAVRTQPMKTSVAAQNDVFTPLKPADGTPYVFSSEADLKDAVLKKREVLIEGIRKVQHEPGKAIQLREELWRLDNAIVQPQ